ncbi:S28 family serine protease [Streptomyces sp. NPDC091272]|uniref:S28 family serine protease n=1 Tax=Streptomyces sp. NPDC091272 TaxID=3365981 RepID=UPI003807E853
MRKTFRGVLAGAVLMGTAGATGGTIGTATAAEPGSAQTPAAAQAPATATAVNSAAASAPAAEDIKDRILAIKGMSLIEEKPYAGYRYFLLNYTQPIDHRHPERGTFQQRLSLLHKDVDRPTVFFTGGYNVSTTPSRSEPTALVDGNQVSLEYRYFTPSRPAPADWSKLNIQQAADDQHRLFGELKKIYSKKWLSTGGSKGGMTATYYERFHPRDMDGVVAYVAPNDVRQHEDSAYDRFFRTVSTKECRDRLNNLQREALVRRGPLLAKAKALAAQNGSTFHTIGSVEKGFENTVLDFVWGFWQYSSEKDCAGVPVARTATDDEIFNYLDEKSGFSSSSDQGLSGYTPYYYQAGTQLGAPQYEYPHLKGLMKWGPEYFQSRVYVPRDIPMKWDGGSAMRDVDRWVRRDAHQMMFVYGQNDPWGSERFAPARGARNDNHVYTVPGANHGAKISGLPADRQAAAVAQVLKWAGVASPTVQSDPAKAKRLTAYDARLDATAVNREQGLRP